mmetsp:Transcript_76871/g.229121  ORF Transcript_76871/g.229121 Transcript_76871/m.229121 type:complete len:221 (+) Transcript_76871:573-1235(+)
MDPGLGGRGREGALGGRAGRHADLHGHPRAGEDQGVPGRAGSGLRRPDARRRPGARPGEAARSGALLSAARPSLPAADSRCPQRRLRVQPVPSGRERAGQPHGGEGQARAARGGRIRLLLLPPLRPDVREAGLQEPCGLALHDRVPVLALPPGPGCAPAVEDVGGWIRIQHVPATAGVQGSVAVRLAGAPRHCSVAVPRLCNRPPSRRRSLPGLRRAAAT